MGALVVVKERAYERDVSVQRDGLAEQVSVCRVTGSQLLLGFAVGMGLVFSVEYLDTRVKTPDQVRQLLGVPIMGALPVAPKEDKNVELLDTKALEGSPLMESYHLLRTNLRFSWENADPKAILVTSAEAGEGKTTVLSHLGIALATAGQWVILIDGDLRRPQLHERFGLPFGNGLTQAIEDEDLQLEDYLQPTDAPNLRVLTAGSHPANPMVVLGSEGMTRVLDASKHMADVVLVDSPPVLFSSDARTLAASVEHGLLVIHSGMLQGGTVEHARGALGMVRAKHVDVVLNKVKRESDTYACYSYYSYSRYNRPGDDKEK